ncbi:hypothetical protein AB0F81_04415 [Actinoplanes sp. NPDC024001]|uniref:SCO7613 C-terminal domain-containing membrane protein n=1 Tax=Actinoplanes sp. NPDC024001 TaxID=3154598 RepID=UPI0033D1A13C
MNSAPLLYPCPYCGATASAGSGCPSCGRAPDPDAIEVIRLDTEIAGLHARIQATRAELDGIQRQLADVTTRRNAAALRVTGAVQATMTQASQPGATQPGAMPAGAMPPGMMPAGVMQPGAMQPGAMPPGAMPPGMMPAGAMQAGGPAAGPAESRLTTLTVQNVLFALGGLLMVVAAAVFTAVAWAQVGVTGRALLLGAATAAVLAVPPFAARRGLTAAAETLAAVGLLMILLDGYAAWAVNFLGVADLPPETYAAGVCGVTAATAFGYGRLVGLTGTQGSALVIAQPVLPLAVATLEPDLVGWSVTLTGVAALNVAVLRLRRARFRADGLGLVAYVCGGIAAGLAALLSVPDLILADSAAEAAVVGGALVLVNLVTAGAALMSGNRPAQGVTGGLLTAAIGVAVGGWALRLQPGTDTLRLSLVALVLAVLVAVVRPRLPESRGPWVGALAVAAVPAVAVAGWTVVAAGHSVEAAQPWLGAPWSETVTGVGTDLPVAAVAVLCAYLVLVPGRARADLGLTAVALVGVLVPAAFRLPWWSAAVLGVLVAAVALGLAVMSRSGASLAVRLSICVAAAGHAVVTGLGRAGVAAGVCAAIALIGIGSALVARSGPRRADAGAGALIAGLFAVPAAVWLALVAVEASPTAQVRVMLGVVVVLCGAVWLFPWYAGEALGVALLLSTVSPLWAFGGEDPVALYAAAALLLVAGLLFARAGVAGACAGAVPLPAVVLLVTTGADLAVVLVEPYRELGDVWSGSVPAAPVVAWSTVVALLVTALAAAVAGLRASGVRVAVWAAAPLLGVAVPLGLAAVGAAWPSVPMAGLVVGLAGLVAVAWAPARMRVGAGAAALAPARMKVEAGAAALKPASMRVEAGAAALKPASMKVEEDAAALKPTSRKAEEDAAALKPAEAGPAVPATTPVKIDSGLVAEKPDQAGNETGHVAAASDAATESTDPAASGLAAASSDRTATGTGHFDGGSAPVWGALSAAFFGALAAAGLAGSTPTHGATLAALGLVVIAAAVIGVSGRDGSVRIAGWVTATLSVTALAYTSADAADLPRSSTAFAVLAAAAVAAGLNGLLARPRPAEARPVAAVAHATAVVALFLSDSTERAAVICTLWAIVLVVRALLPGEARRSRLGHAIAAALTLLLGWWLFLASIDVDVPEVYTLPAAALALLLGWFARRGRPGLPSWTAYGPALAAAFLPTLAVIGDSAATDPEYQRRLLLGAGAIAVLVLGARARLQAPVVVGGGVLVLVALHEVIQFWDLVPRWLPLGLGGLLLVGIATTMEQRRRDLLRLRNAVGRMS